MSNEPSKLPEALEALITAFGNAMYDCGDWNELGDDREPYDDYCKTADVARASLVSAIASSLNAAPPPEVGAPSPMDKRAADRMAAIIDDMIYAMHLDPRSPLADARLDYGKVFTREEARARVFETMVAVEGGWCEWISPGDPDNYGMKCCDCGLVHQAQFRVVRNVTSGGNRTWEADIVPYSEGYKVQFRMKREGCASSPPQRIVEPKEYRECSAKLECSFPHCYCAAKRREPQSHRQESK